MFVHLPYVAPYGWLNTVSNNGLLLSDGTKPIIGLSAVRFCVIHLMAIWYLVTITGMCFKLAIKNYSHVFQLVDTMDEEKT